MMIICIDWGKEPSSTYLSPSMALLAFDLANGVKRNDFLSFEMQRNPAWQ